MVVVNAEISDKPHCFATASVRGSSQPLFWVLLSSAGASNLRLEKRRGRIRGGKMGVASKVRPQWGLT